MFTKLVLVEVLLVAGVLAVTVASGIPTPTKLEGGQVVSVDEAHGLLSESVAEFIEVRRDINDGPGSVPDARFVVYSGASANVPDFDPLRDSFDLSNLPADRNVAVVFYSHGDTGWLSYKAALTAIRAGYRNVFWMRQGLAGWLGRGYSVEH